MRYCLLALLIISLPRTHTNAAEPSANYVLVIGVDGLRPDALQKAATPNFDKLSKNGGTSYTCQILGTRYRKNDTISGPGWSSFLTGVWADKHGVHDNSFKGKQFSDYPHFFARIKSQFPNYKTAHFVDWAPIDDHVVSHADFQNGYKSHQPNDLGAKDSAIAADAAKLITDKDYRAIVTYFGNCDSAGHGKGFHPSVPTYISAIEAVDGHIGKLLTAIENRTNYKQENWLILLSADHGGKGTGHSSGHNVPEILTTPFIVSGDNVVKGPINQQVYVVDIPTTALHHLGVDISPNWKLDGKVIGFKSK
ncbi:MAG: sulfatase-like hydrolase/transferase [Planctomycetaceae bacterium]|nr:sulfatase-like hydrolase/transferase [Planctomycetaceae bacterium]